MNQIQLWLSANKVTLNVKKTKFTLIGSQYKLSCINMNFSVKVNNTPIDRVVEHKHLEVNIDESLIWHSHLKFIMKKTSVSLKVLKRIIQERISTMR